MQNRAIFNLKSFKDKRAELRNNQTEPEKQLWQRLRQNQLGVKFRRQHGIGKYIVDFYCSELSLIVELDGDSHYNEQALKYDLNRDSYLNGLGLTIKRFTNEDINKNFDGVINVLLDVIDAKSSLSSKI